MKSYNKASRDFGCMYLTICFTLLLLQVIFLTMKCTGVLDWSWLAVWIPMIIVFGLPFAILFIVVLALIPSAVWKAWKTAKGVEAEAAKYGMERQPGESTKELKKRIVRRNMLVGNYTRKDIKDIILDKYTAVGSCLVSVNQYTKTITLVLRRAYTAEPGAGFTDDELGEIAAFAAQYIPAEYTITAKNS